MSVVYRLMQVAGSVAFGTLYNNYDKLFAKGSTQESRLNELYRKSNTRNLHTFDPILSKRNFSLTSDSSNTFQKTGKVYSYRQPLRSCLRSFDLKGKAN